MEKVVIRREEERWGMIIDGRTWYRADVFTTIEKMSDCWGNTFLPYGKRCLVSGRTLNGFVCMVYEFDDDDHEIDSRMHLIWMGDMLEKDSGHAIERCLNWCRHN